MSESDINTREAIKRAPLNFETAPWPQISSSAKHLVTHMLDRDPRSRYSADEVLSESLSDSLSGILNLENPRNPEKAISF
jgi:serine/threonine protein kinase